jgi:hypothetical protein
MEVQINKKIMKIKLKDKINELKKDDIIDVFCLI